jgi:hypothetical protein
MDAVVDQNFSECSPSLVPPPAGEEEPSQMMPGDESSCCTSTSFEEWIKTVGFFLLLGRRIHDVSPLFYYCFLAEPVCTESRAFPCLERFLQPQNKELEKKYMLVRCVLGGYFCYD